MQGIVGLRRLSTLVFPVIMVVFIVIMMSFPFNIPKAGEIGFSLSGLTLFLSTNFGITSDLPTFFRHSRSLRTSIIAIAIVQVVTLFFSICGLYFGSFITNTFEIHGSTAVSSQIESIRFFLIAFVFLSVVCTNVANVYAASVGWEMIAPASLVGRKEYLIIGLGLTIIFILFESMFSSGSLLKISDYALVNLCLVLIAGYMINKNKDRPIKKLDQGVYFVAWAVSTFINTLQFYHIFLGQNSSLVVSIFVILLAVILLHIIKPLRRSLS
jgi:hypothetical protein